MSFSTSLLPLMSATLLAATNAVSPGPAQTKDAETASACEVFREAIQREAVDLRHPDRLEVELLALTGLQSASPAAAHSPCRSEFERALRELAVRLDRAAREAQDLPLAVRAERLYAQYLAAFGDTPASYPIYLYEGRLLHEVHRDAESVTAYRRAIELDPHGVGAEEAARMVMVYADSTHDCGVFAAWPKPRADWPACLSRRMGAMDFVLAHMPDSSLAPRVRYQRARQYAEIEDYAHAIEGFEEVLAHDRSSEWAPDAARRLLDALIASGKDDEARDRALELREAEVALSANPDLAAAIAHALHEPAPPRPHARRSHPRAPDVLPGRPNRPPFLPHGDDTPAGP